MRARSTVLVVAAGALAGGLLAGAPSALAEANIKCWTNSEGVRECGNVVPPEYAQQGHAVVSDQGLTREETAPAKTPEQLEAERQAALEAEARQREAEEQARRDRILLDTFPGEDDVILARDGKITNIESQLRLTEDRIGKLEHNLKALMAEAAAMERKGTAVPEGLTRDIESVRKQVEQQQAFIAKKREEQQAIREEYEVYLQRVREIKAAQQSAAPAP